MHSSSSPKSHKLEMFTLWLDTPGSGFPKCKCTHTMHYSSSPKSHELEMLTMWLGTPGSGYPKYSFNLYHHFFEKILEFEIFYLKVGTCVGWTLSGSKAIWQIKPEPRTQTGCLNVLITLFLWAFNRRKKTTASNYLYFWSYGPICSYFWVLPPFMAMLSDHNSWTTDPNFMFLSIFRNVLRCLIDLNHENKGVPLNIFSFLGK